jgi:hypothetical protein
VLDAAEGYREVIMSDITVDRTDRELELNLLWEAGELQADVDVFPWCC